MMITCSECGKSVSDQASYCPHCGKPNISAQGFTQSGANPNPAATMVALSQKKSVGMGVLLTLLFGPFGLLYASIAGGLLMMVISVIVAIATLGFGLIFMWIICVVMAIASINSHNDKIDQALGYSGPSSR